MARDLPFVAPVYLAACALVELLSYVAPDLHGHLGGVGSDRSIAQQASAVLVHGWPGVPSLPHFLLNAVLIVACGMPCERLLGSGRFLVLCFSSVAANVALQRLTDGVNGASLVIWSWGPPLFLALVVARRSRPGCPRTPSARRLVHVLVVMYFVVTIAMTALPYAGGYRGNVFVALALANRYHATATLVGIALTLAFRARIRSHAGALLLYQEY